MSNEAMVAEAFRDWWDSAPKHARGRFSAFEAGVQWAEARVSPAVQETPPAECADCGHADEAHIMDGEDDLDGRPLYGPYEVCSVCRDEDRAGSDHPFRGRPTASGSSETADGASLIADERRRQIEREGWSPDHDDEHDREELLGAAIVYAMRHSDRQLCSLSGSRLFDLFWPVGWDFKPTPDDRVRELVKAGALIAAEIDRLNGTEPVSPPPVELPQEPSINDICAECGEARGTMAAYCGRALHDDGVTNPASHGHHKFVEPVEAGVELPQEGEEDEECANCEDEGPLFRWYARNGDLMWLCEDCHGKCFAWLWDQVPPEVAVREPVEAGVELPDELDLAREPVRPGGTVAIWRSSLGVPWFVPLAVERAIASQAVDEERARYAEGHDMHCEYLHDAPSVDWWQDRMREAREEIARLRGALEDADRVFHAAIDEMAGAAKETADHWRSIYETRCKAFEASASTEAK